MPVVTMPKLSDTMLEGTLVKWRKNKGDSIEVGDILAEVETDKATMEMESFDEGVLKETYIEEGGVVKVGDKIALILADGESADAPVVPKASEAAKSAAPAAAAPAAKAVAPIAPKPSAPATTGRVKASPLARKIAASRGVNLSAIAGTGPAGRIVRKDVESAPVGGGGGASVSAAPAIRAAGGFGCEV